MEQWPPSTRIGMPRVDIYCVRRQSFAGGAKYVPVLTAAGNRRFVADLQRGGYTF
jgi:hypothetical protein